MSWLENKVPPPLVVLMVGATMWPLAMISPALPVATPWRWALAGILAVAGVLLLLAGVRRFGQAKTTINPVNIEAASTLVTTGIFAYTRNPMYLGMLMLLLGWATILAGVLAFLGPAFFFAFITRLQIVPEERFLIAKFGSQYESYRHKVRRWI